MALVLESTNITLSSVTVNSSLLSVELVEIIGMDNCSIRLTAVKVISEDAMAEKSLPSVGNYKNNYEFLTGL